MYYADRRNYDWDEEKRARNLARHGLDFRDVARLDWNGANVYKTDRKGESRRIAFIRHGTVILAVVYTIRDGRLRLISFRRARQKKEHRYATTQARANLND